jgi:hypothetical protein
VVIRAPRRPAATAVYDEVGSRHVGVRHSFEHCFEHYFEHYIERRNQESAMTHANVVANQKRGAFLVLRSAVISALAASCTLAVSPSPASAQIFFQRGERAPVRDPERTFQAYPLSWVELKRENVVMQQRDYSCGAAALATLIQYHLQGDATELGLLLEMTRMLDAEQLEDRIRNGLSMTDLRLLSVRIGYLASVVRLDIEQLRDSKVPLVVGIVVNGYNHFVVYRGMDDHYVYLADPARGNVRTPIFQFQQQWQKNAALVVVKAEETGDVRSIFMVWPEEMFLGTLNREFVRQQATTKILPY